MSENGQNGTRMEIQKLCSREKQASELEDALTQGSFVTVSIAAFTASTRALTRIDKGKSDGASSVYESRVLCFRRKKASGHCGREAGSTLGRMSPFCAARPSITSDSSIGQTSATFSSIALATDGRASGFNSYR